MAMSITPAVFVESTPSSRTPSPREMASSGPGGLSRGLSSSPDSLGPPITPMDWTPQQPQTPPQQDQSKPPKPKKKKGLTEKDLYKGIQDAMDYSMGDDPNYVDKPFN